MRLHEFLQLVAGEPPVAVEREVSIAAPELVEEVQRRHGISLTEFLNDPRRAREARTLSYGHVLGAGLPTVAIESWRRRWPRHPLPVDLVELLTRVNGIHLWADLATGRAYEGLAPLDEWELARTKMWGPDADASMLDDRYLALSYHTDGAAFAVLDVAARKYFLMDACGADDTCPIGDTTGDLLAWLWEGRLAP